MAWVHVEEYEGSDIELSTSDGKFRTRVNNELIMRQDLKALKREVLQRQGMDGEIKVMTPYGGVIEVVRVEGTSVRTKSGHTLTFSERTDWGDPLFPVDKEHVARMEAHNAKIRGIELELVQAKKAKSEAHQAYKADANHKPYTKEQLRNLLMASRYEARAEKDAAGDSNEGSSTTPKEEGS